MSFLKTPQKLSGTKLVRKYFSEIEESIKEGTSLIYIWEILKSDYGYTSSLETFKNSLHRIRKSKIKPNENKKNEQHKIANHPAQKPEEMPPIKAKNARKKEAEKTNEYFKDSFSVRKKKT